MRRTNTNRRKQSYEPIISSATMGRRERLRKAQRLEFRRMLLKATIIPLAFVINTVALFISFDPEPQITTDNLLAYASVPEVMESMIPDIEDQEDNSVDQSKDGNNVVLSDVMDIYVMNIETYEFNSEEENEKETQNDNVVIEKQDQNVNQDEINKDDTSEENTTQETPVAVVEKETTSTDDSEKKKKSDTKKQQSYSDEDYEYLLMVLVGECQSYSWEHQIAVGSVLLNRVNMKGAFKDTIKACALSKGQYQCFNDGNAYRTPTETNKKVAKYLLENGSQLPSNVVYQAQFKQGSGVYKQMGNTYFCFA